MDGQQGEEAVAVSHFCLGFASPLSSFSAASLSYRLLDPISTDKHTRTHGAHAHENAYQHPSSHRLDAPTYTRRREDGCPRAPMNRGGGGIPRTQASVLLIARGEAVFNKIKDNTEPAIAVQEILDGRAEGGRRGARGDEGSGAYCEQRVQIERESVWLCLVVEDFVLCLGDKGRIVYR
ncbi:uncharacterized protein K452DRAFT_312032 [Aplosporella prunicola CBS 121167]|uniref:Uncharacterized protein n=1 Tax=Aplosporella prunicola CBS 121167 TaxID=1176127 RepID=A0A6A6B574_9PEZI|nr:uncharacterized protein K452DRAFT_312032 [Aplosporella prunicola CBS 121167]KAF2137901.1 hypothetical protein K452DRAFT_312032 [Aplosporella prunicola CBS 121167]